MAKIVCRCSWLECENPWAVNDEFYPDTCESSAYCKFYSPDPKQSEYINPSCRYLGVRREQFEKETKSYTLNDNELIIGRKHISLNEIEYLQIDDKVFDLEQWADGITRIRW